MTAARWARPAAKGRGCPGRGEGAAPGCPAGGAGGAGPSVTGAQPARAEAAPGPAARSAVRRLRPAASRRDVDRALPFRPIRALWPIRPLPGRLGGRWARGRNGGTPQAGGAQAARPAKGRSYPKVGWPKARRAQSQAPARANVEPAADFGEEPLAARQARSALADLGDLAGRGGVAVGEAAQRRAELRARSGPADGRAGAVSGAAPERGGVGRPLGEPERPGVLGCRVGSSAAPGPCGCVGSPRGRGAGGASAPGVSRRCRGASDIAGSRAGAALPGRVGLLGSRCPLSAAGRAGGIRAALAASRLALSGLLDAAALRLVHGAAAPHPPRRLGIPERRSCRHRGGTGREAPLEGLARRGAADAAAPSALNSRPAQEVRRDRAVLADRRRVRSLAAIIILSPTKSAELRQHRRRRLVPQPLAAG